MWWVKPNRKPKGNPNTIRWGKPLKFALVIRMLTNFFELKFWSYSSLDEEAATTLSAVTFSITDFSERKSLSTKYSKNMCSKLFLKQTLSLTTGNLINCDNGLFLLISRIISGLVLSSSAAAYKTPAACKSQHLSTILRKFFTSLVVKSMQSVLLLSMATTKGSEKQHTSCFLCGLVSMPSILASHSQSERNLRTFSRLSSMFLKSFALEVTSRFMSELNELQSDQA